MKKKGNKILLITAGILLLVIIFVIYHFFFGSLRNQSIGYNNPRKLVEGYIGTLINKDYKESIRYIYLPDDSFVNRNDFEKFIKTKYYYNEISDMTINSISDDDSNEFDVTLNDKDGNTLKITVGIIERTKNDYRIDESDIYIKNYFFSVPKNTDVFIDDYEVSKDLIAKQNNEQDYYLLPAIANNEKTFKLVSKLGEKSLVVTPVESNEANKINIELTEEFKNRAYSFIKSTWNDMYSSYSKKVDVKEMMKYFDESFTEDDVKQYYSKSFKKISTGLTSIGKFQNYKISKMVDNPDDESIILSDELIKVNFGYTLKWNWKWRGATSSIKMNMNRYSSIVLKVKDDSFVIYEIPDVGLFNYSNRYTRDF